MCAGLSQEKQTLIQFGIFFISVCPTDWVGHNQHCYKIVKTPVTQAVASSSCSGLDDGRSRLIDIEDAEENTFIRSLCAQHGVQTIWTGMGDFQTGESHKCVCVCECLSVCLSVLPRHT